VTFVRARIQTEAGEALAARYEVTRVPSFLLFRDGKLAGRWTGVGGARELGAALRGLPPAPR
jgi:hypothetical protein